MSEEELPPDNKDEECEENEDGHVIHQMCIHCGESFD